MKFNETMTDIDKEKTFGELKFGGFIGKSYKLNPTSGERGEVRGLAYLLRCKVQEEPIRVTLPPEVSQKDFKRGDIVELIEPEIGAIADRGTVNVFIRAKDIVLKGTGNFGSRPAPKPQSQPQGDKKD